VRKYIERGIEAPAYGPRSVGRPSKLAHYMDFVRERVTAFPDLSAVRLTREIRELGYAGAYTAVKRYIAAIRPENGPKPYEVRFETPPGVQAQVDFARFVADFTDDPGTSRIVWLFSLVLGHSRFLFARYVLHQDLQTLLRCHMQAFEAIGGVPIEILYDRMKTAVTGEDGQGHIIYNRSLLGREKMGIPISGMLPVYLESRHELIGFLDAPGAVCGEATITVRSDGRDIVLGVLRFVRERSRRGCPPGDTHLQGHRPRRTLRQQFCGRASRGPV